MESSNDEEEKSNIYRMTNHQYDEVTSHFSYHDIFRICKKLTKETNKLEKIVFAFKDIIFSLESKNKTLEK